MGYVDKTLLPGEAVVYRTSLHWIIYLKGFGIVLVGLALLLLLGKSTEEYTKIILAASGGTAVVGVFWLIREWVDRLTTEFVVTNKRVVKKYGLIRRNTQEMNLAKIESVQLQQGIWGRILGYGTVAVIGTGGSTQIDSGNKRHDSIAAPLKFREAVQSQSHP